MTAKIYPCCDDQDCPDCQGFCLYVDDSPRQAAQEMLRMAVVADLNQEPCRQLIRELCRWVLENAPY